MAPLLPCLLMLLSDLLLTDGYQFPTLKLLSQDGASGENVEAHRLGVHSENRLATPGQWEWKTGEDTGREFSPLLPRRKRDDRMVITSQTIVEQLKTAFTQLLRNDSVTEELRVVSETAKPTLWTVNETTKLMPHEVNETTEPTRWMVNKTTEPTLHEVNETTEPTLWTVNETTEPTLHELDETTEPTLHELDETTEPTLHELDETTEPTLHELDETTEPTLHELDETTEPTLHELDEPTEPTLHELDETTEPTLHELDETTEPTLHELDETTEPGSVETDTSTAATATFGGDFVHGFKAKGEKSTTANPGVPTVSTVGMKWVKPSPETSSTGPAAILVGKCLLAIFLLALVAAIFIVSTAVLATLLWRQRRAYRLNLHNPREMVCISSLLAAEEADEAGGQPRRVRRLKLPGENGSEVEMDRLTLNSFLPDH
ncbi:P-selectin glycoprotein ligand 1 [Hemicordylus capensis]|uniref:P-selectin glycoprotein ligand 1 n=1 Tax=Hemicordylus capensis TaxID=884348 RepID=UPI0023038454|nr:P-selectin glycoprotein ligand 1 [Hemicordylus capensis]